MNDKDYCKDLTDLDDICCMDIDTWLSDCSSTASRFRLTKDKLTYQCNIPARVDILSKKCPVKYTVLDKNKDHSDCLEVSTSAQSIICSGIDEFLKNCPYQSFIKGASKDYLESQSNIDCSSVKKFQYKPVPKSEPKSEPKPVSSSFFNRKNIFIAVILIIIIFLIYYKWKTK